MKVGLISVDTVTGLMEELIVQTSQEKPSLGLTSDHIKILTTSMAEKFSRLDSEHVASLSKR